MRNKFHVGALGKRVQIQNISSEPELTPSEALELAAYLVATAIPLSPGEADTVLDTFIKMIGDAAEDPDVSAATAGLR